MASLQTISICALILLQLVVPDECNASSMTTTLQYKCEKYAAGTPSAYDFCMKTMEADRASATADARGLAVIAARIARTAAKATADKIQAALRANETSPARWACLSACAAEYAATVRQLGHAARVAAGPAGGGDRELADAQALLAKAYGAPVTCDKQFSNAGLPDSPVSPADRQLDEVISLAIDFLPVSSLTTRA
jgi:pectinesterase inhibitor-like protein